MNVSFALSHLKIEGTLFRYFDIAVVYLKASMWQKSPPIAVILHHFAGCSRVCTYAHILSEGHYDLLFST